MVILFSIAKCKTKAGYSAKLRQQGVLHLQKIKQEFEIVLYTPILVVLKVQGVEVIVHKYGELFFKNCTDVALMERIAEKIYDVGLQK